VEGGDVMNREKYIKPEVKQEVLEAEVLTANHGSPNGENGNFTVAGWQWKKNWH
jgi:hypothetical protein